MLAAGVVVVGIVLLAVTIRADLGAWWLVPVALLLGVQLAGLRLLWTRRGTAAGEEGTGRARDGSPPRRGHGQVTYRVDREL